MKFKIKKTGVFFIKCHTLFIRATRTGFARWKKILKPFFSPEKNKAYANGESKCFVLLDQDQQPVGRISAFIDHNLKERVGYCGGGIGFFECVENQDFAFALFQKATDYLAQFEVKVIDGPINFGERDKYWGLLVNGFYTPIYQENYNPRYYRAFFENWGFKPYEQILTFRGKVKDVPIERFRAIAERVRSRYDFHMEHPNTKKLNKYAVDFANVYNASFQHSPYFKPIESEAVLQSFQAALPISDTKTCSFAYTKGQPIGFCILLPEVNPFFKPFKGKLNLLNSLRFLYNFRRAKKREIKGVAFGIHPDFHKKGLFSLLVQKIYDSPGFVDQYLYFNLTTIRAYNGIMVKSTANLGGGINRVHYTYRKVIDPTFVYEPFEFIPEPAESL